MSQKASRRTRRQTDEDSKPPTPKPNGTEEPVIEEKTDNEKLKETPAESIEAEPEEPKVNGAEKEADLNSTPKDDEMDPLIIPDEPDPELAFSENSDLDSGRSSPVLTRCKTRRSQTRNIPTPKTPRGDETPMESEEIADATPAKEEELNETFDSCSENVSTRAQVGGDSTRLNYSEANLEPSNFLETNKNKSFGETLKRLSTRRTIRPVSDDYRKRVLKKAELGEYPRRSSVERVSVKRKGSEEGDDDSKRLKRDSPGFFARFTSPLASFRNKFGGDLMSSTPKLTGYKDEKFLIEDDNSKMCEVKDGERRWCSIM